MQVNPLSGIFSTTTPKKKNVNKLSASLLLPTTQFDVDNAVSQQPDGTFIACDKIVKWALNWLASPLSHMLSRTPAHSGESSDCLNTFATPYEFVLCTRNNAACAMLATMLNVVCCGRHIALLCLALCRAHSFAYQLTCWLASSSLYDYLVRRRFSCLWDVVTVMCVGAINFCVR